MNFFNFSKQQLWKIQDEAELFFHPSIIIICKSRKNSKFILINIPDTEKSLIRYFNKHNITENNYFTLVECMII